MNWKILVFIVSIMLVRPGVSWGYIDPGSGMAFVSGIGAWVLGLVALCFGAISITYKRWKNALGRFFSALQKKLSFRKDK